jgi:hypothetical protein
MRHNLFTLIYIIHIFRIVFILDLRTPRLVSFIMYIIVMRIEPYVCFSILEALLIVQLILIETGPGDSLLRDCT